MPKKTKDDLKQYYFKLSQHIGAPSEPVVKVGKKVKRGELIAKIPEGKLSANLHSSVNGKVFLVDDTVIGIEADPADQSALDEFVPIKGGSILEQIEAAGIVGMGGAGFPTAVKLKGPLQAGGTVILNAAECEPVLGHNIERIEKHAAHVYNGLLYAMKAANADEGVIAIKGKHAEAVKAFKEVNSAPNVTISLLEDIYPSGEERAIIRDVKGILLEVNQLPLVANCIVINAETAARIADAVDEHKPVISKDITIGGQFAGQAGTEFLDGKVKIILDVPTGTPIRELIKEAGGLAADYGEVIIGGPFTGKSLDLSDETAAVTKVSGGILASMPFVHDTRKAGLLVCACGANAERLKEIADKMGAPVAGVEACKQAIEERGALKCENPGHCPGQAEKIFALRKAGAEILIVANCTDCTNTVMSLAPQLKMPVYHSTDGVVRTANTRLVRWKR
jgi:proline reductase-associated electron transfer protein PrdC